jgi:hypothetical protein
MKKIYFLALVLISKLGFGQTITAVHPTLNYSGPDNVSHSIDVEIQNSGSTTLTILVQRVSMSMASGHQTYFCWFECYDPSIGLSPVPMTLAPGESTANFHGWVTPAALAGQDTVTYAFYDQNGMSDTLYLTLSYDFIHDGINEISFSKNSLNISVNENKTATINYACNSVVNSKIQISNILGRVVKEIRLTDKTASLKIPLSEISQGIYFCNLIMDDKFVSSKKFLIQR